MSLHLWDCRERTHVGERASARVRALLLTALERAENKGGVTIVWGHHGNLLSSSGMPKRRRDGVEEEEGEELGTSKLSTLQLKVGGFKKSKQRQR